VTRVGGDVLSDGARGPSQEALPAPGLRHYLRRVNYPDTLFDLFMYPLEAVSLTSKRRELMREAAGDVLELGAGTGVNLAYYDQRRVGSLTLSDLSITERVAERAREFRYRAGFVNGEVRLVEADALDLPFADESFDTVVFTLVFCSVPDQAQALGEVHRVLRPGGRIVFIEHVRPHGSAKHLADRLNPVWHATTGECNINRETAAAIAVAGFRMERLTSSGGSFLIDGVATKPAL